MEFIYSCYRTRFTAKLELNKISFSGLSFGHYKDLSFEPGTKCSVKFNRNKTKGIVKKITFKCVHVEIEGKNTVKFVKINDFISDNRHTLNFIRIEKNGFGPYQSQEKTPELVELIKVHKEKHHTPRRKSPTLSL